MAECRFRAPCPRREAGVKGEDHFHEFNRDIHESVQSLKFSPGQDVPMSLAIVCNRGDLEWCEETGLGKRCRGDMIDLQRMQNISLYPLGIFLTDLFR